MTARITGLRPTAFTSFHDVVVPLEPLTVLIGGIPSATPVRLWTLDDLLRSYS